jgi:uncharacterized membrane protein
VVVGGHGVWNAIRSCVSTNTLPFRPASPYKIPTGTPDRQPEMFTWRRDDYCSMSDEGEETFVSKNRLEALIDGVFAFAMTLLVISLAISPAVPDADAARMIPRVIAAMWPEFINFLTAFFILGAFWVHHHRQFHLLHSVDMRIVRLTFLILVSVVLVPFTTNVSGDYSGVQSAVALFHLNLFVIALLFFAQWQYIIGSGHLTTGAVKRSEANQLGIRLLTTAVIALLGIAISFSDPGLSLAVYLLLLPLSFMWHWLFSRG